MVFTCLLMKPLDFGYKGDDVMCLLCWFAMNLAKFFDQKGGTLSGNSHLDVLYCEISCWNLIGIDFEVLEKALYTKEYLLIRDIMDGVMFFCS